MDQKPDETNNKQDDFSGKNYYYNHYHFRNPLRIGFIVIGTLIVLCGVFFLGRVSTQGFADRRVASVLEFSGGGMMRDGQSGGRSFGGRGMMGGNFERNQMVGSVTKIDGNNLTIKVSDTDYQVAVSDTTSFAKAGAISKLSDLKVGDIVAVSGSSNSQGQIAARLIRIK